MTLPASGDISMSQVNTELGFSSSTQRALGDAAVRTLFSVASGAISLNDGHGKSAGGSATFYGSVSNTGACTHYTWVVPTGVSSVSVLAVNAGNGKNNAGTYTTAGPPGGAIGFINNYPVCAGNTVDMWVAGTPTATNNASCTFFFGQRPNYYTWGYTSGTAPTDSLNSHCNGQTFGRPLSVSYLYQLGNTPCYNGGTNNQGGQPVLYCRKVFDPLIYNGIGTSAPAYRSPSQYNGMNLCGGGASRACNKHGARGFMHACAPTTGRCWPNGRAWRAKSIYYGSDANYGYGPSRANPCAALGTSGVYNCANYSNQTTLCAAASPGRFGGGGGGSYTVVSGGSFTPGTQTLTYAAGGGGGMSIYGEKPCTQGAAGTTNCGGSGAWAGLYCCKGTAGGGTGGTGGNGGAYGSGGGGGGYNFYVYYCSYNHGANVTTGYVGASGNPGGGFIRIVWPGCSRKWPSTKVCASYP